MRSRKAIKVSSDTICIFCAHRLDRASLLRRAALQHTRSFQSGTKQSQSPAVAEVQGGGQDSGSTSSWGRLAPSQGQTAPSQKPSSVSADDAARAALMARLKPKIPEGAPSNGPQNTSGSRIRYENTHRAGTGGPTPPIRSIAAAGGRVIKPFKTGRDVTERAPLRPAEQPAKLATRQTSAASLVGREGIQAFTARQVQSSSRPASSNSEIMSPDERARKALLSRASTFVPQNSATQATGEKAPQPVASPATTSSPRAAATSTADDSARQALLSRFSTARSNSNTQSVDERARQAPQSGASQPKIPQAKPAATSSADANARQSLLSRFPAVRSNPNSQSADERARQALLARSSALAGSRHPVGQAQETSFPIRRAGARGDVNDYRNTQRHGSYRPSSINPRISSRDQDASNQPSAFDEAARNWQHVRKRENSRSFESSRDRPPQLHRIPSAETPPSRVATSNGEDALTQLLNRGKPKYTSFLSPKRQGSVFDDDGPTKRQAPARANETTIKQPEQQEDAVWSPVQRSPQTTSRDTNQRISPVFGDANAFTRDAPAVTRARRSGRNEEVDEEADPRAARGKIRRNGNRMRGRDEDADDDRDSYFQRRESKKDKKANKKAAKQALKKEQGKPIVLPAYISVANLAPALNVKVEQLIDAMGELGFEDVDGSYVLNSENASLVAIEFNYNPTFEEDEASLDLFPIPPPEDKSALPGRPPVVTIMGHVDHGKTTILDYLRKSAVVASEFGGITQHIGAFSVPLPSGKTITFLDTPGHSAFETMRKRGANVTDIVVLVVAADDSVKPQTVEAIKHAQSAQVPIIVAINKMDKEDANPDQVKRDLAANGIEVEDYGGDVQAIPVSGKTGSGLDDLEEAVVTLSEILDYRAATDGQVEGWVLEASTKKSGKAATVLVRRGTLHVGDILVAGTTWTRVRTLKTDTGALVDSASPGQPVEVDGWRDMPVAGDEAIQAPDEHKAESVVEHRLTKVEQKRMAEDMEAINEYRRLAAEKRAAEAAKEAEEALLASFSDGKEGQDSASNATTKYEEETGGPTLIPFVIKADVSGSAEAINDSIAPLGNAEVGVRILRSGVGSPSEFDIEHAAAAKGHVISFNLPTPADVRALAKEKGVQILEQNVIYRLGEEVRGMLAEKLPPRMVQRVLGEAEVGMVFEIKDKKKNWKVAGCKIRNGLMKRGGKVKVLRKGEVIHDGIVSTLKNVKKDVEEMHKGNDCGLSFEGRWEGFQEGDHIQYYDEKPEKRTL